MIKTPEAVVRKKLRQVAHFEALSAEDLQDMLREYFSAEENLEELSTQYTPSVLKLTGLDALVSSSEALGHQRSLEG